MAASERTPHAVVVGAGPAGLTAAYELARRGAKATVLEREQAVGGIARTVRHGIFRLDIGGHRLYTKMPAVKKMWNEILGGELKTIKRVSRIYYGGRFYDYPLKLPNLLSNLGFIEGAMIAASYLKTCIGRKVVGGSFEDYVTSMFGRRLYEMFFKGYTEKVWGVPCSQISSEWAAQRISNMSLTKVLKPMLLGGRNTAKSLIDEFQYPRLGIGQLWEALADKAGGMGVEVRLNSEVIGLNVEGGQVRSVTARISGSEETFTSDYVISTMPLPDLACSINPKPPADVLEAAGRLKYRDFILVGLVLGRSGLWRDNWIYVNDGGFRVGRVANYGNWSSDMVPDSGKSVIGMEYFTSEGSDLWGMTDQELIEFASGELVRLRLAGDKVPVLDGIVCRMRKAYPIYDPGYKQNVQIIREYLKNIRNLQTIGRAGLHRYNNMDHSMLTGIFAAGNVFGEANDVWGVNDDDSYLESKG